MAVISETGIVYDDARKLHEECGVAAVFLSEQGEAELLEQGVSARDIVYWALAAQIHRGQQNTGLAVTTDGHNFDVIRGKGPVASAFEDGARLDELPASGRIAIGHNRYTTSGGPLGAQPTKLLSNRGDIVLAHNGNFSNHLDLPEGTRGEQPSDTWLFTSGVADEMDAGYTLPSALIRMAKIAEGAFSIVAGAEGQLVAMRDPRGMRPLSLGRLGTYGWMLTSETGALDAVGATYERGIKRGELLTIDDRGPNSIQYASREDHRSAFCAMEDIYLARPDHLNVREERISAGRILFEEAPLDVDLIVPILDSGREYAQGYAEASGIAYAEAIGKVANERAFMASGDRQMVVSGKHLIDPALIKDKRIVIIDDSIVRGDTLTVLTQGLMDAGANEVHIVIGSPPIEWPCFYGVDFPESNKLAMHESSVGRLKERFQANSLHYLSMSGLERAFGAGRCTACFTGDYPTDIAPIHPSRSLQITPVS